MGAGARGSRFPAARVGVALLAGVVLATVTVALARHDHPVTLWFASAYVWSAAGILVLHVLTGRREVRDQEAHLRDLRSRPAHVAAERAVLEERRQLAVDIRGVLVDTVSQVRDEARATQSGRSRVDEALPRMRALTHLATSELRRLLGILRSAEEVDPALARAVSPVLGAGVSDVAPGDTGSDGGGAREPRVGGGGAREPRLGGMPAPNVGPRESAESRGASRSVAEPRGGGVPRADLLQAGVLVVLGSFEAWYNQRTRFGEVDPAIVVVTALAAATFAGRSVAPVLTSVVQALLFATSGWAGSPVMSGVWLVRGVGSPLWRSAARAPRFAEVGAAVLLATTVMATRQQEPPIGVWATAAVVVIALVGGLLSAATRRRGERAAEATARAEQQARLAVAKAVTGERVRVARELHDVVSHSVGLLAMQLNVLEVAADDPARQRALADVVATSDEALRELLVFDRFPEMPDPGPRTMADVEGVVERVRRVGGRVDLTVLGQPPAQQMGVVYRVVQEALTNAMQHAPGADVRVRVEVTPHGTTVQVHDDGPGPRGEPVRRYGMVGLRERVTLAGGRLDVRPGEHGGFEVDVVLPPADRVAD